MRRLMTPCLWTSLMLLSSRSISVHSIFENVCYHADVECAFYWAVLHRRSVFFLYRRHSKERRMCVSKNKFISFAHVISLYIRISFSMSSMFLGTFPKNSKFWAYTTQTLVGLTLWRQFHTTAQISNQIFWANTEFFIEIILNILTVKTVLICRWTPSSNDSSRRNTPPG